MPGIPFDQRQRILREVYRHYLDFKDHFSRTGSDTIKYGPITISYVDLQDRLKELSPRKKQAVWLNVICDKKQKEVAEIMGITTVSVGQYVEQAMLQLSEKYFADMPDDIDLSRWIPGRAIKPRVNFEPEDENISLQDDEPMEQSSGLMFEVLEPLHLSGWDIQSGDY